MMKVRSGIEFPEWLVNAPCVRKILKITQFSKHNFAKLQSYYCKFCKEWNHKVCLS